MSDQISINQTVPVVSESVSSDNRTTCLFIMEEDRRIIEFRASVTNMGFNDYLVAAGYENPLRYQVEQIRSVYPYCEECINRISDIKQEWLHDAFQKEILDMRSSMEYGDNAKIIPEEIPELLEYMDEVMPKKPDADNAETKVLDTVIDVEAFLGTKEKTGA